MIIFQIDHVVMIVDLPELDGNDIRDGILDSQPTTSKPVQPATPITVMKNLDLYLIRLRAVILEVNDSLRQMKVMFSMKVLRAFFGAFGLNN